MAHINEPARQIPIIHDTDVLVLGGSCTGVFAALRAARLGCRVALVERAGAFGGVATISQVNVWHTSLDTEFKQQIFAGLTIETMDRLRKRSAVIDRDNSPAWKWCFNPAELMIELDELVTEGKIKVYLHTAFVSPHVDDNGKLVAAIVENKTGRGAIAAKMFVDATGDADLCARLGLETYTAHSILPSTTTAIFHGWLSMQGFDVQKAIREHAEEYGMPQGFAWGAPVPPAAIDDRASDLYMFSGTRVAGASVADADALTGAEIEGRRQVRAVMDIIRKHHPENRVTLAALPARIGIRESRHVRCGHQLTGDEVLNGTRFDDAIANGSYRVDIHHTEKPGLTFRYLDGTQIYCRPGYPNENSRWRPETPTNPTFYQVPLRSLIPKGPHTNVIVAGRMLDADAIAHAGVRVMVNMNQTGEAAGVAAYVALNANVGFPQVPATDVRKLLAKGGSVVF